MSFYVAASRRCGLDLGWVFLFQIIALRKHLSGVSTVWVQLIPHVVKLTAKVRLYSVQQWHGGPDSGQRHLIGLRFVIFLCTISATF